MVIVNDVTLFWRDKSYAIVALAASLGHDSTIRYKSVDVLAAETRKTSRFHNGKPIV